jgi:hypothetical protein
MIVSDEEIRQFMMEGKLMPEGGYL